LLVNHPLNFKILDKNKPPELSPLAGGADRSRLKHADAGEQVLRVSRLTRPDLKLTLYWGRHRYLIIDTRV